MKALSQLHRLRGRVLDKETKALIPLETRKAKLQRSLDALGVYQREMSRLPAYGSAFALHNRSIMHRQLGDMIEKQHDEEAALRLSISQQKRAVLNAFVAKKSGEIMLDRLRIRQAFDQARREQKAVDELTINRVCRTPQGGY